MDETKATPKAPGKLEELLATEEQLEALLERARDEAEQLVQASQTASAKRLDGLEQELEIAGADLAERIRREHQRVVALVQQDAQREQKRLQALDDQAVEELARALIGRLLGASEVSK